MTRSRRLFIGIAAALLFAHVAPAKQTAQSSYLEPDQVDILAVLPPAPVAGDPRYEADREIFRMTRKLEGTPRWAMAVNDVIYGKSEMMRDFSCALGFTMTPGKAPLLSAMLDKAGRDTQRETRIAKNFYKRQRPYKIDDGAVCQSKDELADSFDYPSGHTTGGWTWALVLSDVVPDRASAVMARGRAYGESRIVCGAHNASAVEAGRLSATITMTVVRNTAAYQRDLKAARAEIKQLRKTAPAPIGCDAEKSLISQNIFAPAP